MVTISDAGPRSSPPAPTAGLSRADRKRIEPDEADKQRFRELLEKGDFGLIKLLNVTCGGDGPMVVHFGQCNDSIPGHGADFSFRQRRHVFPALADLKLNDGIFIGGSVMTQGLLVSIGKVDIRTVDLSIEAVNFLSAFVPAVDARGAQQQTQLLNKGIWRNGLLYRATAPVREEQTYIMRTIAYRTKNDGGDRREDLVVAFTVARFDKDGNVTLIWRELRRKQSPRLDLEN